MASSTIEFACSYAKENHKGQMYGNVPYIDHLLEVWNIALRFKLSETIQVACWLHDIIEDTQRSYTEIKLCFGHDIAEIVYCVTDELGRDRNERKAKTYPKIAENSDAVYVKLCDRIANIENAKKNNNSKKLFLYKREHREFIEKLYVGGKYPSDIWAYYMEIFKET